MFRPKLAHPTNYLAMTIDLVFVRVITNLVAYNGSFSAPKVSDSCSVMIIIAKDYQFLFLKITDSFLLIQNRTTLTSQIISSPIGFWPVSASGSVTPVIDDSFGRSLMCSSGRKKQHPTAQKIPCKQSRPEQHIHRRSHMQSPNIFLENIKYTIFSQKIKYTQGQKNASHG